MEQYSVRQFVSWSAAHLGITLEFEGEGVDEIGRNAAGEIKVSIDPAYFRPTEVDLLIGDPTKAKTKLGWEPKITLDEMVAEMVASDLERMGKEADRKERDG